MKSNFLLLFITIISCSCQKELSVEHNTDPIGNPLTGTWDFLYIDVQALSSEEHTIGGFSQRYDSALNYTTENNAGRYIITDSVINTVGLTYTITSKIKIDTYTNGVLTNSNKMPYNVSFYEAQSSCNYKMVASDSISFPKAGFTNIAASTLRTDPLAAKISFSGDTLTFKQYIYKDTSIVKQGAIIRTVQTGTAIMTLKKHGAN